MVHEHNWHRRGIRVVRRRLGALLIVSAAWTLWPVRAGAQVPKDIAAGLCEIGRVADPAATARLYRPLHPGEPYKDVSVVRGVSFGPDPRNVVDIFTPPSRSGGSRPILIFVSGGEGNRRAGPPPAGPIADGGDAFYDNIMLWAVKSGMIGVNMERRSGAGASGGAPPAPTQVPADPPTAALGPRQTLSPLVPAYDDTGAKDVAAMVQWVRFNALKYNGNPNRVFIWAHSAGVEPVAGYIGHPELYGSGGIGLKGAILMSGQFSMFPLAAPAPVPAPGSRCPAPKDAGGPGAGAGAAQPAGGQDVATLVSRSNLLGFLSSDIALIFAVGEIDSVSPAFNEFMRAQLCAVRNCPSTAVFKDHSHMSLVFSPNTQDDSVTGPLLRWMRSVR